MLTIEGAAGEGGGQVLRTALALSLVTKQPFAIRNIRAARSRPGLLRQHLAAVSAAAVISRAEVSGASLGSSELAFTPGCLKSGEYTFAVGSAGSATLVLQTVLPALALASGPSTVVLKGGTHNPYTPPYEFLAKSFLPVFNRMGPRVSALLVRHGFYPAGEGELRVSIEPCRKLGVLALLERGLVRARRATAIIANLPRHIAERELALIRRRLQLGADSARIEEAHGSAGPGNVLLVEIECEHVTEVVTAFGQRGLRAETVAEDAAAAALKYLAAGVPAGEHLADQLLIPLALAGAGAIRTLPPTAHAIANAEVIGRFLDGGFRISPEDGDAVTVEVSPRS